MADGRAWPALIVRAAVTDSSCDDLVSALVDEFSPVAIEELTPLALPPGGLWDPTYAPVPELPSAPLHWRIFFAVAADRDRAADALRSSHPELVVALDDIADGDWAARSQRSMTAVTAGAFIVAPPWNIPTAVEAGTTVIVIEPSRGFGTGHHASTRLCLRALSETDVHGKRVLDLGTGSGVLAMAAALKHAGRVLAVDVDPDAIAAARASQLLNPAAAMVEWRVDDFRRGDGSDAIDAGWDLVLANLTGGMLRSSADRIRELIAPGGVLIASGFDEGERPLVQQALDLREEKVFVEDGWVGLIARRPLPDP